MNSFLWETYTNIQANDKLRYWVDLWESMIEDLSDPLYGLVYMNPHLLVRHIIDEIVFNNFKNPDNRAFFQKQLDLFLKSDPATKKLFSADMALIRREFGGTRFEYLLQLCRTVDLSYGESSYLDELFSCLRAVICNPVWESTDDATIHMLCQCMIVELHLKGYSLETIKTLPASIFDKTDNYTFSRWFKPSIKRADYETEGKFHFPRYNAALQAEFENLDVESRMESFRRYFHPEARKVHLIFQVEGLKGDTLDISLANVNLYSPKMKRLIKSIPGVNQDYLRDEELFGQAEDACFANAAVSIDEFDTESSKSEAVALIEGALDLFRTFVQSKAPFRIPFRVKANRYIRVSCEGEYLGNSESGESSHNPAYKHFFSIDLSEIANAGFSPEFLTSAGVHLFEKNNCESEGLRIANSLHWYRKAEEAQVSEDRLLAYWIVLENIVSVERDHKNVLLPDKENESKFSLIREIIPSLEICLFLKNAAPALFRNLVGLLNIRTDGRPHLTLPQKVIEVSLLNTQPKSRAEFKVFVQQLNLVANAIDCRNVKNKILRVFNLHTDIECIKKEIDAREKATQEELLLLYRLRNRIVHNAHYDNSVLPLLVDKLRKYAGNVLRQVLSDIIGGREQTIERSLLRYYVSVSRIKERLSKGEPYDVFDWMF